MLAAARKRVSRLILVLAAVAAAGIGASTIAAEKDRGGWTTVVVSHVPEPHLVVSRAKPAHEEKTRFVEFVSAPFPYNGNIPASGAPFLNVNENGRLGHRTAGGNIHWLDESYSDRNVLLHVPKRFDVRKPALMVLFFHGHRATLERDVLNRQRVAEQVSESGVNAVLVAPQLAYDTADSSAGKLWLPGGCRRLLSEASAKLAGIIGSPRSLRTFENMPVIIVGYSGGYLPAAACVQNGNIGSRVRGIALLDGLYGEMGTFKSWLMGNRSAFFVSSYTGSTRTNNLALRQVLEENTLPVYSELPGALTRGSIAFLPAEDAPHRDFVTHAWSEDPVADLLQRARTFAR